MNIDPITIPLRELRNQFKDEDISAKLQSFHCCREEFIENYVRNKSVHAEIMGDVKSYLILDTESTDLCILGYYALTLKVIHLRNISGSKAKCLHLKKKEDHYIPTYYIALLAKNDIYKESITGNDILNSALATIQNASLSVGGRAVWVEAKKENQGVVDFYQQNEFKEFQQEEQHDGIYLHLIKTV
jgi:hypothetical protein